jgi:hypothetical protein
MARSMRSPRFVLGACLLLVGCGADERVCDFSEVVQMPSYDQAFRDNLADDVDQICGNNDRGIPAEYETACKFIQDSLELRAQIAATQEN